MSDREQCIRVLDSLTAPQLADAAILLRALKRAFEDAEDEEFCKQMEAEYEADPEKGDFMPIEDFARSLGIDL